MRSRSAVFKIRSMAEFNILDSAAEYDYVLLIVQCPVCRDVRSGSAGFCSVERAFTCTMPIGRLYLEE
jgi:hypothetical protein